MELKNNYNGTSESSDCETYCAAASGLFWFYVFISIPEQTRRINKREGEIFINLNVYKYRFKVACLDWDKCEISIKGFPDEAIKYIPVGKSYMQLYG